MTRNNMVDLIGMINDEEYDTDSIEMDCDCCDNYNNSNICCNV